MTAPTEVQFQRAVLDLAAYRGWLVFHDFDSRRNTAGFPDLVCVHERTGDLVFAELKSDRGRVSQVQQRWLDALLAGGHETHVWRPGDLRNGRIARALTPSDARGVSA